MITTCKLDRLFEWWMASGPGAFAITTSDTQTRKNQLDGCLFMMVGKKGI